MQIKLDKRVINDAYLPMLFNYSNRYECYYGGAGSGKSHFIGQKLVAKAINSKRKILVVRKVGTTLRDSCFQLIKDTLQFYQIYDKCEINKTDMKIHLPNGSDFLFKSLDDPEKVKSITAITDIWIEECTECTLDDISQLDLRLRARVDDLQMIFSFNPVSKSNWVYTYFKFDSINNDKYFGGIQVSDDTWVIRTTYKDNKFLPESYIKGLLKMKETNELYYQIYALGAFGNLGKLIYTNWMVDDFDYIEVMKELGSIACFGLDFGYTNDPSAFVAFLLNEKERLIHVFDEIYETGLRNNQLAGRIIEHGWRKEVIVADCQEKKSIDELKKDYNIPRIRKCGKGKGSVNQGIQYLQQFKILVHPSCENFKMELENYTWKKDAKTGLYLNEPIDKFNHLMDATRYGVQTVRKIGKVRTYKKSVLGL